MSEMCFCRLSYKTFVFNSELLFYQFEFDDVRIKTVNSEMDDGSDSQPRSRLPKGLHEKYQGVLVKD